MSFLKNTWYVAANAYELDAGLVSRKICNEQIVMFRKAERQLSPRSRIAVRIVSCRCRWASAWVIPCNADITGCASMANGTCVEAPHDDDSQKARACVKGYAVVERDKLIWLWLGDAAAMPTPRLIRELRTSSATRRTLHQSAQGYSHLKCNYQLISDNLLDLSHIHYLHPGIHEGSNFEDFTNKVEARGR